jgi:hypothetical protein
MKRSLGFILFLIGLGITVHAQTPDSTRHKKANPTKQAVRQLKMLQQQLNLTGDQVTQMQVILIHRDVTLDSLRNTPTADRRAKREVNREADQKINALLTADQKPLYQQWKQQQRQKLKASSESPTETQNQR